MPEFVGLPPRELLLEQPQIVLLPSENLKHSAYSIVTPEHAAWEQLAGEFGSALLRLEASIIDPISGSRLMGCQSGCLSHSESY
jgi:hypothetical protein